mmetsp:Transcript_9794/g.21177  ORF Transcript_9794/g.21177 Transcript_9794/m.21177 type:complete len:287 (-) Transcript_9794:61-921(-)
MEPARSKLAASLLSLSWGCCEGPGSCCLVSLLLLLLLLLIQGLHRECRHHGPLVIVHRLLGLLLLWVGVGVGFFHWFHQRGHHGGLLRARHFESSFVMVFGNRITMIFLILGRILVRLMMKFVTLALLLGVAVLNLLGIVTPPFHHVKGQGGQDRQDNDNANGTAAARVGRGLVGLSHRVGFGCRIVFGVVAGHDHGRCCGGQGHCIIAIILLLHKAGEFQKGNSTTATVVILLFLLLHQSLFKVVGQIGGQGLLEFRVGFVVLLGPHQASSSRLVVLLGIVVVFF